MAGGPAGRRPWCSRHAPQPLIGSSRTSLPSSGRLLVGPSQMFPFSSPSSLAARRWAARRTPRRLAPVLSLALLTAVTLRLSSLALRSPRGRVGNSHEWPNKPLEWPNKPLKEAELSVEGAPFFQHEPARLRLPAAIRIPQTQDGAVSGTCTTGFLMVSFYSEDYTDRARRLQASCSAHAVCCSLSLVPRDAFGTDVPAPELRARLIATKPLFMLAAHVRTGLPIAWVDIDFEVVAFPALFVHGAPLGAHTVHLRCGLPLWRFPAILPVDVASSHAHDVSLRMPCRLALWM